MGFLDRFKKQKEQEVEKKISTPVVVEEKTEKTEVKEKVKKPAKEKAEKVAKISKKKVPEALSKVLIKPLITEKSAILTPFGQYVFEVELNTNRRQVAAAVLAVYGVKPVKVGIIRMRAEPVRFGRFKGKQKAWKKAVVRLPKGKTITVHEGV